MTQNSTKKPSRWHSTKRLRSRLPCSHQDGLKTACSVFPSSLLSLEPVKSPSGCRMRYQSKSLRPFGTGVMREPVRGQPGGCRCPAPVGCATRLPIVWERAEGVLYLLLKLPLTVQSPATESATEQPWAWWLSPAEVTRAFLWEGKGHDCLHVGHFLGNTSWLSVSSWEGMCGTF